MWPCEPGLFINNNVVALFFCPFRMHFTLANDKKGFVLLFMPFSSSFTVPPNGLACLLQHFLWRHNLPLLLNRLQKYTVLILVRTDLICAPSANHEVPIYLLMGQQTEMSKLNYSIPKMFVVKICHRKLEITKTMLVIVKVGKTNNSLNRTFSVLGAFFALFPYFHRLRSYSRL